MITSPDDLNRETLLSIIDTLYGELDAVQVSDLAGHQPEVVDACRVIHDKVGHDDPHHQR